MILFNEPFPKDSWMEKLAVESCLEYAIEHNDDLRIQECLDHLIYLALLNNNLL